MTRDLSYDRNRPLYLPSGERFSIEESRTALEIAYGAGKPVLIYIHGRAKKDGEPRKSVKQKVYEKLERYGVSIVGFTWDAQGGGYDPSRAEASSADFDSFLVHLAAYLADNPSASKPALLAHSMGNLIVADLADDDSLGAERGALLSNIVFSAAAVKTKHHDRWLARIGVSERNYVVVNPDDKMLLFNGFFVRPDMLGRELRRSSVALDHATYVSLDELDVNHRYFAQQRPKNLRRFFEQALTGKRVDFEEIAMSDSLDGVPVQSILSKVQQGRGNSSAQSFASRDPVTGLPMTD